MLELVQQYVDRWNFGSNDQVHNMIQVGALHPAYGPNRGKGFFEITVRGTIPYLLLCA